MSANDIWMPYVEGSDEYKDAYKAGFTAGAKAAIAAVNRSQAYPRHTLGWMAD